MNPNQKLYARISLGGKIVDLFESEDLLTALSRASEVFLTQKTPASRNVQMVIELSNVQFLGGTSMLTREQQMEQEIMANAITDLDEVIGTIPGEPDVTLREAHEAWGSEVGKLMFKYQRADNRFGVDPEMLNSIKHEYETKYRRVSQTVGPRWPSE